MVRILSKRGMLAEDDRTMLLGYCMLFEQWLRADDEIKASGGSALKINSRGVMASHPAAIERRKAWAQLQRVCSEFGMSPSARTGLAQIKEGKSDTGKDRFFNQKFTSNRA